MSEAFLCGYARTPIGRHAGALSSVRADDLAAIPIRALLDRHPDLDPAAVDEVVLGCANQAGEDNRNVARMALLLAGLPDSVPGTTINRPCGSGMDALTVATRAIRSGEQELVIAGGAESMSRAPFVMPKADAAFSRAAAAITAGRLAEEIVPVTIPRRRGEPEVVDADEHSRATSLEALSRLRAPFREGGTVTAGNASGVNDGAAALIVASEAAATRHGLTPIARVTGGATAGVAPRVMGMGPVPATWALCARLGLGPADFDVVELNEAFASQAIAVLRALGLAEDAAHVNPNGGAIALGHPLGMSGARLAGTATLELSRRGGRHALATVCVGVGQGVAIALERV